MVDLKNIKLGHSKLTDTVYLFRHGKDEANVLDKRKVEDDELMAIFIDKMMYKAPKGAEMIVRFGEKKYKVICVPEPEKE